MKLTFVVSSSQAGGMMDDKVAEKNNNIFCLILNSIGYF